MRRTCRVAHRHSGPRPPRPPARRKSRAARAARRARRRLQPGRGRARLGRAAARRRALLRRLRASCSPTAEVDAVFLVTPTSLHAAQIIAGAATPASTCSAKSRCRSISPTASACSRTCRAGIRDLKVMIGYGRRFDPSYRDAYDKIRAGTIGRPFLVRSQNLDMNDPVGFLRALRADQRRHFSRLHACTTSISRAGFWAIREPVRVFATGVVAIARGLREFGDVDNGVATCEFDDGKTRVLLRVAHDGARSRDRDRNLRHGGPADRRRRIRASTASTLPTRTACATNARRRSTSASRRHSCARRALRRRGARRPRAGADPARRDRSDAHRARAARVAADTARDRAVTRAQRAPLLVAGYGRHPASGPSPENRACTARPAADALRPSRSGVSPSSPIKIGLRELPPFALAALRFFFAAVPLVFFVKRPRHAVARDHRLRCGDRRRPVRTAVPGHSSSACPPACRRW